MVRIRDIQKEGSIRFGMTQSAFAEIMKKIPGSKTIPTAKKAFDAVAAYIAADESRRDEAVKKKYGENANIVSINDPIPNKNNPYNSYQPDKRLWVMFIQPKPETEHILSLPPPRQEGPRKRGRPPLPFPELESEDIIQISAILRKRFRPRFGLKKDIAIFKNEIRTMIRDVAGSGNEKTADYIFDHIDFREVEVQNDPNFLLYYVMRNSSYKDFGDYVIQLFCDEARSHQNPLTKKEFGCFFRCVIDQVPKIFKNKKPLERLAYIDQNVIDSKMTIESMEKVASEFGINISILDVELRIIKLYSFASDSMHKSVTLVAKDNHVYSLKPSFKKSVCQDGCHTLIKNSLQQLTIEPIAHGKEPLAELCVANISFKESNEYLIDVDGEDDPVINDVQQDSERITDITIETDDRFSPLPYYSSIEEKEEGRKRSDKIITITEDELIPIYTYYRKRDKIAQISDFGHSYFQLTVRINESSTYYFRTRSPCDFDIDYPARYTATVSSVGKYLFRRFMKKPIPKMTNPLINTIFKELCKPFKTVLCGNVDVGYIYLFDLSKAYFNSSNDLFIPQDTIIWEDGVLSKKNVDKIAAYMIIPPTGGGREEDGIWRLNTSHTISEKSQIGEKFAAYIPIREFTSDVYNFGVWLRDEGRKDDHKMFFNSLIGCMHPSDVSKAITVIFHNEIDFCRFITFREGKNIIDIDVDRQNSIYKIKFTYDEGHHLGFNLSYFPAQIIQRCNRKVMKLRNRLDNKVKNVKLLMTMTDSVICHSSDKLPEELLNEITKSGEWNLKIKEATRIDIRGIGKYRIWKNDKIVGGTALYDKYYNDDGGEKRKNIELKIIDSFTIEKVFDRVNPHTHRLVIGSAGVGKSRWICETYWDRSSGDAILTASTGIAASSINGLTVHSAFGIIRGCSSSPRDIVSKMSQGRINILQKASTIVIDEGWMVRRDDMNLVDKVLKIVNNSCALFGGKKLVIVGDDRQLSSVKGAPFVGNNDLKWETSEIEYTLNGRMKSEYKLWTDSFRVSRSKTTIEEYIKKVKDKFSSSFIESEGVLTVFFTNKEVDGWNEYKRKDKERVMDREPLILRKNINVKKGLFNGKIGKAKWITSSVGEEELFFEYTTPFGSLETKSFNTLEYKKDYFLAYAITIHKAQGLTIPGINIGLLNRMESDDGVMNNDYLTRLFYVAFTRVSDFSNVYLF